MSVITCFLAILCYSFKENVHGNFPNLIHLSFVSIFFCFNFQTLVSIHSVSTVTVSWSGWSSISHSGQMHTWSLLQKIWSPLHMIFIWSSLRTSFNRCRRWTFYQYWPVVDLTKRDIVAHLSPTQCVPPPPGMWLVGNRRTCHIGFIQCITETVVWHWGCSWVLDWRKGRWDWVTFQAWRWKKYQGFSG